MLIICLAFSLAVFGCSKVNQKNYDKLKVGNERKGESNE
jgi:hypothetical protein